MLYVSTLRAHLILMVDVLQKGTHNERHMIQEIVHRDKSEARHYRMYQDSNYDLNML